MATSATSISTGKRPFDGDARLISAIRPRPDLRKAARRLMAGSDNAALRSTSRYGTTALRSSTSADVRAMILSRMVPVSTVPRTVVDIRLRPLALAAGSMPPPFARRPRPPRQNRAHRPLLRFPRRWYPPPQPRRYLLQH